MRNNIRIHEYGNPSGNVVRLNQRLTQYYPQSNDVRETNLQEINAGTLQNQNQRRTRTEILPEDGQQIIRVIFNTTLSCNDGYRINWKKIEENEVFKQIIERRSYSLKKVKEWFNYQEVQADKILKRKIDNYLEEKMRQWSRVKIEFIACHGVTSERYLEPSVLDVFNQIHSIILDLINTIRNFDILSHDDSEELTESLRMILTLKILQRKNAHSNSDIESFFHSVQRKRRRWVDNEEISMMEPSSNLPSSTSQYTPTQATSSQLSTQSTSTQLTSTQLTSSQISTHPDSTQLSPPHSNPTSIAPSQLNPPHRDTQPSPANSIRTHVSSRNEARSYLREQVCSNESTLPDSILDVMLGKEIERENEFLHIAANFHKEVHRIKQASENMIQLREFFQEHLDRQHEFESRLETKFETKISTIDEFLQRIEKLEGYLRSILTAIK